MLQNMAMPLWLQLINSISLWTSVQFNNIFRNCNWRFAYKKLVYLILYTSTMKPFTTVIVISQNVIFTVMPGAYQSESLYSNGRILALPENIRLGRKWLAAANTLAYYDTAKITPLKVLLRRLYQTLWPKYNRIS